MSSKTRAWLGFLGLVVLAVVVWRVNASSDAADPAGDSPTYSGSASSTNTPLADPSATADPTDGSEDPADEDPADDKSTAPGHINIDDLPDEAWDTLELIDSGGPFPYSQDGVVFENREGRLPKKPSGYYHEYTVKTPGSSDRGARRIIESEDGDLYYTDDHYESFLVIDS